jgi:enoyl-CoA hydratase/carnithine racemase
MTLHVEIDGPIAIVLIDNPAKRNAMTAAMWQALPTLLAQLQDHPGVRVVMLTGSGDVFCAGADIGDLAAIGAQNASGSLAVAAEEALAAFPKPTIAAVNGDCIGGGCQLALACDIRLAEPHARFGITPARLGIVYPARSTRRLVRLAGVSAAQWLLLTGELVFAEEALAMRLVHEVTETLGERAAEIAETLAQRSLLSQVAMKELISSDAADPAIDEARMEHWMAQVRDSGEAAEGAQAFLERRPPKFSWRPGKSKRDEAPRDELFGDFYRDER